MNRLSLSTLALIGVFVASQSAFAQDTGGVAQPTSGTIVKGKAPVTKELLKVRFPKPASFKLKNGLSVYVLEDHRAPAVRFNLQIHAGSLYETKAGVAACNRYVANRRHAD